ncbi:glycosyltransferase [Reinekea marinisedimentorum]|uniref:Glycosyltransferase involved in cell wall biosynthesis n=1 Tax=Reinekea marinisedimentorum TaxID=230495 RepID=A0A4R3IGG8_9GAMM|nr:glycosyltransferase [Reinekea marinisedimentorum]TCS44112.1 glycosyltransferase involved in cell wall biosynthesis [Reinekea marinisedimentorum]
MANKKPTVLHVIDTTGPGGAETVFLDLAENMDLQGYNKLALIKGSGWVEQQLKKRQIPYLVLKPYGFLSLPYYLQLFRIIKKYNVQYIQAHLLGSALSCSILRFLYRVPVVATLHGQVDVNPNERFVAVKRWILKVGLSKVVAVSGQLASYLESRGLFNASQLEVIHNGISTDRYTRAAVRSFRLDLGLNESTKLIGSVGNIRPAKDYKNLIEAAALVIEQEPGVHFLIAGHSKQPLQGELDALVAKLQLGNNVHFLGFVDDTPSFLAQLDVFALSSSAEGFSIATLEAMAANVPVVVTKCGGPEEIITPGVDGIMVPVGNPRALSEAIISALAAPNEFVTSAHEKVVRQFSMQAMVSKYLAIAEKELEQI